MKAQLEVLTRELAETRKALAEALEQQTATSEVLQVISSSPGELEPVFETMLANATRICEASFGTLLLYDGDVFRHVALHNAPQAWAAEQQRDPVPPRHAARVLYRVADTKQVAHIADIAAENPDEPIGTIAGARTLLIVPMLKENALIGVFGFTARRSARSRTNRLSWSRISRHRQSLRSKTPGCSTSCANPLRSRPPPPTCSRSSAARPSTCRRFWTRWSSRPGIFALPTGWPSGLPGTGSTITSASYGHPTKSRRIHEETCSVERIGRRSSGRVVLAGKSVHILDAYADPELILAAGARREKARTVLGVPLLRDGKLIGVLVATRPTLSPFTDKQIELLTTFADQAVIAIENVRLFDEVQARTRELSEALEQQTATSEVLQVISSSPGELEPVFQSILANATQICEANFGNVATARWGGVLGLREDITHRRRWLKERMACVDRICFGLVQNQLLATR